MERTAANFGDDQDSLPFTEFENDRIEEKIGLLQELIQNSHQVHTCWSVELSIFKLKTTCHSQHF
jgi:hypothetical protein